MIGDSVEVVRDLEEPCGKLLTTKLDYNSEMEIPLIQDVSTRVGIVSDLEHKFGPSSKRVLFLSSG